MKPLGEFGVAVGVQGGGVYNEINQMKKWEFLVLKAKTGKNLVITLNLV